MTKDHILREIKRTAEANGGIPLGRLRFLTETGIKDYDWGKYWARWSDAVRESGLEPNKLQGAYGEPLLLERYARFVRELGRTPTPSDLRLKSRDDPEFPSEKTLRSRFGTKPQLVKRAIEYFKDRKEFTDVVQICQGYERPAPTSNDNSEPIDGEIGYVYLAKSGRYYKIGRSNATGRREYELGIQLPENISTVHVIRTDDPIGIEAYWHKRFVAKRKKGEWFQLTAADVSVFKRRKFM